VAFGVAALIERPTAPLPPARFELEEGARNGALGAAVPLKPGFGPQIHNIRKERKKNRKSKLGVNKTKMNDRLHLDKQCRSSCP
jgi:hypothetical protein